MKYRQVLDEVQPHYTIVSAVLAAGAAAYSASQQAKTAQRAKRTAANAAHGTGGMETSTTPTAGRFGGETGSDSSRLQDSLMNGVNLGPKATDQQQGMTLGLKTIPGSDAPEIPEPSLSAGAQAQPSAMPITKIEDPKPVAAKQDSGGLDQYSQIAQSLAAAYAASQTGGPTPGPIPQLGPMNLTPTAYKFR